MRRSAIILLLLVLAIGTTGCEQENGAATPTAHPTPTASPTTTASTSQLQVASITKIMDEGKSLDWSPDHNLIISSKPMPDEEGYLYYDVIVFNPDGSDEKCLTCDKPGLPNRHQGNPAWHPSGDWIVFTAEKATVFREKDPYGKELYSIPGKGMFHDLYVMDSEGTRFFRVYEVSWNPLAKQGLIHPQFSHSGDMVIWAQREGEDPHEDEHKWGVWATYIADFVVEDGEPRVENVRSCQPGERAQFYETHGFSEDDTGILYAANQMAGQPPTGMDIYVMDIAGEECGEPVQLTTTFWDWDEHAHYSPDREKMAWMPSEGFDVQYPEGYDQWSKYLTTELWIMNADGTGKQRLTFYNEPGHDEYTRGRTVVADSAWSPDGSSLVACVTYAEAGNPTNLKYRELHLITLECPP